MKTIAVLLLASIAVLASAKTGLFLYIFIQMKAGREKLFFLYFTNILKDCLNFHTLANRELLGAQDDINKAFGDAKDEIDGFFATVVGKACVLDDNCMKHVSYCEKSEGFTGVDGQCRPNIWVWLVLAGVLLLLVGSCVCCLLCGLCKCLYNCLCCCCRDKGYTPANTVV